MCVSGTVYLASSRDPVYTGGYTGLNFERSMNAYKDIHKQLASAWSVLTGLYRAVCNFQNCCHTSTKNLDFNKEIADLTEKHLYQPRSRKKQQLSL